MTPKDLTEYLNVLRTANVISAHLVFAGTQMQIVFGPDNIPDAVGTKSEPGAWKSPVNLDSNKMFESPEHDV